MDVARLGPVLGDEPMVAGVSFGPVDLDTFLVVEWCLEDVGVPDELCSTFLRRLAGRVNDRVEWVRTIRLLLCSMYGIGCDSEFFDAVLAALVETGDGATVAVTEARRIGADRGFGWLDEACRVRPAADAVYRAAA